MGDWWYYVTSMTFGDIAARVKPVDEIHERQDLKNWIQRELSGKRLNEICQYLLKQKQRFFNAIIVAIYEGEPEWFPVKVSDSPTVGPASLDERSRTSLGLLRLSGGEEIFAVDGQHRVEGIKLALKGRRGLAQEEQCIIFVAHKKTRSGRERTRRLFSTLNRYAKPVSKGEIIALSEDDAFAIVTRRMVDEYPHLQYHFVPVTKTTNIPASNKRCVTSIMALYDLVVSIAIPKGSREKKKLMTGPADARRVQEIFEQQCEFWDALRDYVPEIREVIESKPERELASNHRTAEGGHVLFRPTGQVAFGKATRTLMDRGKKLSSAVHELSRTQMELNSPPWLHVLWNPTGRRMIHKNQRLAQNVFLHMAGQECDPTTYGLEEEYRRALDDPGASLSSIPVVQPLSR